MPQRPRSDRDSGGCRRLRGRRAIVTGADSGIGRAVEVRFAREGADAGDVGDAAFCPEAVARCLEALGGVDALGNNAAEQPLRDDLGAIGPDQLERTFRTNIVSMFFMTQAALPHLGDGAAIVNSASVTAYHGNPALVGYSATRHGPAHGAGDPAGMRPETIMSHEGVGVARRWAPSPQPPPRRPRADPVHDRVRGPRQRRPCEAPRGDVRRGRRAALGHLPGARGQGAEPIDFGAAAPVEASGSSRAAWGWTG